MKKRKPLKPSFVVTVAAGTAALATAGCFGWSTTNPPYLEEGECPQVIPGDTTPCETPGACHYETECGPLDAVCEDGQWSVPRAIAGCEPPVECPKSVPEDGTPCSEEVGTCVFNKCGPATYGYPEYQANCVDGAWYVSIMSCNPPELYCPLTVPAQGDRCFDPGSCEYSDECGQPVTAFCDGSYWNVQYEGTCNPPPPCEYLDQDGCGYDPSCVWHTPGCGDETIPALPQAGCFSITSCTTDADCPIGTCQQVMVTPDCVDEGCDACGMAVNLCVQ